MFWRILEVMIDVSGILRRFKAVGGILDERSRRLVAAAESAPLGRGGVSAVSRATGISGRSFVKASPSWARLRFLPLVACAASAVEERRR